MAIPTAFTDILSVRHPIVSAPMGGEAGGALAAAVSEGGGLGLVGGGRGDREWVERELRLVRENTTAPWGVGFLSWAIDRTVLDHALSFDPAAVLLSFGDPLPLAATVRDAGAVLIVQVTDADEARRALDAGADVLVAQGSDAGGHCAAQGIGTLSFVPTVVDLAGAVPVLAAGGIADGRAIAAALALGAAGAMVGTRFQATHEALVPADLGKALVDATGGDTEVNWTLDIARGAPWPEKYPARTLRNTFIDRWRGRDDELRTDEAALREYRDAAARNDLTAVPVWAGQAVDRITSIASATELVGVLAEETEAALRRIAVRDN
ncbi:NAD(P)H-dependent flavin oxidoreductase [Nocardia cerradoensis]|uniref:Putative monooxygenase n=1 Tax=Nocardia cerradoensis TaxID=85688 RepID=A0A231H601_9NOCA|nr:nitronate monooxygenase [Nocardia cerradoensis]NKY44020.1 nitronate monooxygenase [Nocardia cerradoensis]OXR44265.1 putative monooxygenase [Nocardia cerradoensis]